MFVPKGFVVLFSIICYSACINIRSLIPSFIKPCKLNDPTFETCALSVAQEILQRYSKGDMLFQVPPLTVYKLPVVAFVYGDDFGLRLRDAKAYGLDTAKVIQIKKTPNENKITATINPDKLDLASHLYINAKINNQHIFNHGIGNITIVDPSLKFTFTWTPILRNFNSTKIIHQESTISAGKLEFNVDFEDLDKEAGSKLNKFLTENSEEIGRKIIPSINVYLDQLFYEYTHNLFNIVPYNLLFLE